MQPVVIQTELCTEHADRLQRMDHTLGKLLGGDPEGRFPTSRESDVQVAMEALHIKPWASKAA